MTTPPMPQPSKIHYDPQLKSLIKLMKSDTDHARKVQAMLYSGEKEPIIDMLTNFGNPGSEDWKDYTEVLPWSIWQIQAAVDDLHSIKNPDAYPPSDNYPNAAFISSGSGETDVVKFWAW
jgi:hypothetical protein